MLSSWMRIFLDGLVEIDHVLIHRSTWGSKCWHPDRTALAFSGLPCGDFHSHRCCADLPVLFSLIFCDRKVIAVGKMAFGLSLPAEPNKYIYSYTAPFISDSRAFVGIWTANGRLGAVNFEMTGVQIHPQNPSPPDLTRSPTLCSINCSGRRRAKGWMLVADC